MANLKVTEWTCTDAARKGRLDILQQLRSQKPPSFWDSLVCARAAENGHLHILQWARAQDQPCPWNQDVCTGAAKYGHLHILQWARAQNLPCQWNIMVCIEAAANGHLPILQWARTQNPPCPWDERICQRAAENGHLHILQWARAQTPPCPWDVDTCQYAARHGHFQVVEWARAQTPPCPWNENTCLSAIQGGHLDILQWAYAHGSEACLMNFWAYYYAATLDHLDVLQWMRKQDSPYRWSKDIITVVYYRLSPSVITWIICCDNDELPQYVPDAHWYNVMVQDIHALMVVELLEDIHTTDIQRDVVPKDVVRLIGDYASVPGLLFDKEAKFKAATAIRDIKGTNGYNHSQKLLNWLA